MKDSWQFIKVHRRKRRACAKMGNRLSVLVIMGDKARIALVSDRRICRLNIHLLKQLTEDPALAQLSVELGYLKPDEIRNHPSRNMPQAINEGADEVPPV